MPLPAMDSALPTFLYQYLCFITLSGDGYVLIGIYYFLPLHIYCHFASSGCFQVTSFEDWLSAKVTFSRLCSTSFFALL